METDLITSIIDKTHRNINYALENRDIKTYAIIFDEQFKYIDFEKNVDSKNAYITKVTNFFKDVKAFQSSQYRIKSTFENEIFTEKIAKKSIFKLNMMFIFTKKQTIQTEEIYRWKNINGEWKIIELEIKLEEKY